MVEGRVKRIDPTNRLAVIATAEGKELTLHFGEESYIEVPEPATMGSMSGTLEDLKEGYWVQAAFVEKEGNCHCSSLSCLS